MLVRPITFFGSSFLSEAQTFFDAVIAAGGSLTTGEKNAINTYITDLKAANLWTSIIADYPFVGASSAAHKINLKTPGTFNLIFVNTIAGDHTTTGWKPNGTTSYARTQIVPTSHLTNNSVALEYYSRTNASDLFWDIGAGEGVQVNHLAILTRYSDGLCYFDSYWTGAGRFTGAVPSSLGSFIGSRRSATDAEIYRNGASVATSLTGAATHPQYELYLGADNEADVAVQFSPRESAGASIYTTGLTDTQALNQYNARQNMNTTLNRQV